MSSLSYKDLYLNWKENQVLIFTTKCTLINFSNPICQRQDVLSHNKLQCSCHPILDLKLCMSGNFTLSHFKAVTIVISNRKLCPVMPYYALFFFASVATQKSVKICSQKPVLFQVGKHLEFICLHYPFLLFIIVLFQRSYFYKYSSHTLLTVSSFPSSLLMPELGIEE